MRIIFEAPINSLSFGNVAINLLREMWKRNMEVGLFPIGKADASAHNLEPEFANLRSIQGSNLARSQVAERTNCQRRNL